MKTSVVRVPASLLLHPGLPSSAKLIWMLTRLDSPSSRITPAILQARSGLSRPTVLKGMANLASLGWAPADTRGQAPAAAPDQPPSAPWVRIPSDLLLDHRISVQAKVLHGILQLTPGFCDPTGTFTYAQLSSLAGRSINTVKQAVRDLVDKRWLQVGQLHQHAPVRFACRDPRNARGEAEVEAARRRLEEAPYRGEALMREYLSLLVDSDHFEDDAAPGFLVNPLTDERMQLDRFYPPNVAFEFNGPQHYGPTDLFSGENSAKQRARDYMKLGICISRGIQLVTVLPEDLRLKVMQQKVGTHLRLRDLRDHAILLNFLEMASRRYRQAAKRGRFLRNQQP